MIIRTSILVVALLLVGCAQFPDKLKVDDLNNLVSYQDAASKAEQVTGKQIRWGGAIAKIENKEKTTILEMVYYPLTSYGRPIADVDASMGRFRIEFNGFMDPLVYQEGRLMTFIGELKGLEKGLVGEHKYVFPVVKGKEFYIWKKLQRVDIRGVQIWPHDYWFDRYPRPYRSRLIIHTSGDSSRPSGSRPGGVTLPKPIRGKRDTK